MKITQIKKFNNDIIEQIEQIENRSFTRPWSRKEIIDDIENNNSFSYILIEKNEIIGYMLATKIIDEITINKFCIKKEKQKRGYGTKIFDYFINEAEELNVKKLFLEVNIHNKTAIKIYKKNGFQINRIRKYDSNNENTVYEMIKIM